MSQNPTPSQTSKALGPGKSSKALRVLRGFILSVLSLTVLAGAAFGAWQLIRTRPKPERRPPIKAVTLVEVEPLERTTQRAMVNAMGTVTASREIVLQPRVSGEIVEVSAEFVPGGHFEAGETIIEIDRKDYELALARSVGEVARARHEIKVEQGRQDIAKREWGLLGVASEASELDRELALRESHLQLAEANLAAAEAMQDQAEVNLGRTEIAAPFNGMLTYKHVDKGAQVTPQTQLGTFVGTDEYWVRVSVPVDRLAWLEIPTDGPDGGSPAVVIQAEGLAAESRWNGRILRLLGDVEPQGRMARVLVAVHDPLGLKKSDDNVSPLLIGSYVSVEIAGREVADVFVIPRTALRDGNKVWLFGDDDTLVIREVTVVWRNRETVLIRGDLKEGDCLIVSDLVTPVEGMALQVAPPSTGPASAAATSSARASHPASDRR